MTHHPRPVLPALSTPEGVWKLEYERKFNYTFHADYATRLTLTSAYVLCNCRHALYIYALTGGVREPLRILDFRSPATAPGSHTPFPTCHACTGEAEDPHDVLIGFSNGDLMILSLDGQLQAGPTGSAIKPIKPSTIQRTQNTIENVPQSVIASAVTSVAWIPHSLGQTFVAAFRDGTVGVYRKLLVGNSSDDALLVRTSSYQSLQPQLLQSAEMGGGGVAAVAPSPDGSSLAVASKDGCLRVYDLKSGTLITGFQSYYGGLLCCAWSHNGKLIAAGGEDDLVAIFHVEDRCIISVCEGHQSWVTSLDFDAYYSQNQDKDGNEVYRLASAGQDACVYLWEVEASLEEDVDLDPNRSKRPGHRRKYTSKGSDGSWGGEGWPSPDDEQPVAPQQRRPGAAGGRQRGTIVPALARADMPLIGPLDFVKAHIEPVSDVKFTRNGLFTACYGGNVKKWSRPAESAS